MEYPTRARSLERVSMRERRQGVKTVGASARAAAMFEGRTLDAEGLVKVAWFAMSDAYLRARPYRTVAAAYYDGRRRHAPAGAGSVGGVLF